MGLCRILIDVLTDDTLAVEAAGASIEYARARGRTVTHARVIVHPGESDEVAHELVPQASLAAPSDPLPRGRAREVG